MQNCLTSEEGVGDRGGSDGIDFLTDTLGFLFGKTKPNSPERQNKCELLGLNQSLMPDDTLTLNKLYSIVQPAEYDQKDIKTYFQKEIDYYYTIVLYIIFGFSFLIYIIFSNFNIFRMSLVFIFLMGTLLIFKTQIPIISFPKIKPDIPKFQTNLENNFSKLGNC